MATEKPDTAVWALTDNGLKLAERLREKFPFFDLFLSEKIDCERNGIHRFLRLKESVNENFKDYNSHIFIMSTGITIRMIADQILSKLKDPAVIVMDDLGKNVISILSGHIGGANELTLKISDILGSNPVITTATDVNNLPSIDTIAVNNNLYIENPEKIKSVNSKILKGEKLKVFDPDNLVLPFLEKIDTETDSILPDVYVSHRLGELGSDPIILRPKVLSAGIGCNRGTGFEEIKKLLFETLKINGYSLKSLENLATIDIKNDEEGILKLAKEMGLPIKYYSKNELNSVESFSGPSDMALKHVGVKSVCEAAAIMASKGKIVIPKNKTKNVTIAIAMCSPS